MTDPIDDLTVRTAFTRLRAQESAGMHPPGVAAAERSVRRRRYVASAAGGLTALALLSSGAAATVWQQAPEGTGPVPGPTAAGQPATPTASTDPAGATPGGKSLAEMTEAVLGDIVGDDARIFAYGGFGMQSDPATLFHRDLAPGVSSGPYRLTVVCGGDGGATATLAMGGQQATATARCGTTPEEIVAGSASVTMEAVDPVTIQVEMGGQPDGMPEQSRVALIVLEFMG